MVLRVALVVLLIAVTIYALIMAIQADGRRMPAGLSKPVWIAFIILVPIIGPLVYLSTVAVAWQNSRSASPDFLGGASRPTPGGQSRPSRPRPRRGGQMAPDDDPEFLARLEAERRRKRRQKEREAHGEDQPPKERPIGGYQPGARDSDHPDSRRRSENDGGAESPDDGPSQN